jgi:hypothetical protein
MITIPVVTERCAGIDVGKRGLAVAVAVGPADKEAEITTQEFGTTVPALRQLQAWLRAEGCTSVALESTGSYWIPVKPRSRTVTRGRTIHEAKTLCPNTTLGKSLERRQIGEGYV